MNKHFPADHKVSVLHKEFTPAVDNQTGLAVGRTFSFPTGDRYTVQESGAVVNADPKPYKGKAGRKAWLKQRRYERFEVLRESARKLIYPT